MGVGDRRVRLLKERAEMVLAARELHVLDAGERLVGEQQRGIEAVTLAAREPGHKRARQRHRHVAQDRHHHDDRNTRPR